MKKDKEGSASMPVDSKMRSPDDGEEYDMMHAVAQDLISAIHSKNVKGVAEAMKAAFELSEELPHNEGPHQGED